MSAYKSTVANMKRTKRHKSNEEAVGPQAEQLAAVRKDPDSSKNAKDFVEHVRTVHFALVLVSLALSIAVLSHDNILEKAKKEMATVNALQPFLSLEELKTLALNTAATNFGASPRLSKNTSKQHILLTMQFGPDYSTNYVFTNDAASFEDRRPSLRITTNLPTYWHERVTFDSIGFSETLEGDADAPRKLAEFVERWDSINPHNHLTCVLVPGSTFAVHTDAKANEVQFARASSAPDGAPALYQVQDPNHIATPYSVAFDQYPVKMKPISWRFSNDGSHGIGWFGWESHHSQFVVWTSGKTNVDILGSTSWLDRQSWCDRPISINDSRSLIATAEESVLKGESDRCSNTRLYKPKCAARWKYTAMQNGRRSKPT